ncbi:MAG: hypothetical protein ABIE74_02260 [Pseudomonadota bacterium]
MNNRCSFSFNKPNEVGMATSNILKKKFEEIRDDAGRGGCGILAIADLSGRASHDIVRQVIDGLVRMEHRGGSLDNTGDGAGLLLVSDRKYFERFIAPMKHIPSRKEPLIVGTIFFLHAERNVRHLQREMDVILLKEGLSPLGWREVPLDESCLGKRARVDVPLIFQIMVAKGHRRESQLFNVLHDVKIKIEKHFSGMLNVASLAPYTTVYKALATADQLADFYPDLKNASFVTNSVIAHRRFSTNTFSNWNLVQPFRFIAHNGEINTITANCRAIRDAESAVNLGNTLINHGSDSAQFDRVVEMMSANGINGIHEAIRRMVPPSGMNRILASRRLNSLKRIADRLARSVRGRDQSQLSASTEGLWLRPLTGWDFAR